MGYMERCKAKGLNGLVCQNMNTCLAETELAGAPLASVARRYNIPKGCAMRTLMKAYQEYKVEVLPNGEATFESEPESENIL